MAGFGNEDFGSIAFATKTISMRISDIVGAIP